MKTSIAIASVAIQFLLVPLAAAQDGEAGLSPATRDAIRSFLARGVEDGDVAGGALILVRDGKVVFREGFGWADVEQERAFAPETLCAIASLTKPSTATVIAMLAERGELALSDPVSRWIPAFAEPSPTVAQLLSHTSGLPGNDDRDEARAGDAGKRPGTLAEVVDNIARRGLEARPGKRFEYSGLGYDVAARVAEIATGKSYDAILSELLLEPLAMRDTSFHPSARARERLATTYFRIGGQLVPWKRAAPIEGDRYTSAGGGLFSTIDDQAALLQLHLDRGSRDGKGIVRAETLEALYRSRPAAGSYGLGFQVRRDGGRVRSIHHGGASGTLGWVDFERRVVGVVLTQVPTRQQRDFTQRLMRRTAELLDRE